MKANHHRSKTETGFRIIKGKTYFYSRVVKEEQKIIKVKSINEEKVIIKTSNCTIL